MKTQLSQHCSQFFVRQASHLILRQLSVVRDIAELRGISIGVSVHLRQLVQEGGDVLFVPAGWAHSTLNVEVSVGVVHDNWRVPLIDSCEADKMTRV